MSEEASTPDTSNPSAAGELKIFLVSSTGAGFAKTMRVPAGTTLGQLVYDRVLLETDEEDKKEAANRLLITVNKQHASKDYVLREGDQVVCSPSKLEGAA